MGRDGRRNPYVGCCGSLSRQNFQRCKGISAGRDLCDRGDSSADLLLVSCRCSRGLPIRGCANQPRVGSLRVGCRMCWLEVVGVA